jgi:hypothetical protein
MMQFNQNAASSWTGWQNAITIASQHLIDSPHKWRISTSKLIIKIIIVNREKVHSTQSETFYNFHLVFGLINRLFLVKYLRYPGFDGDHVVERNPLLAIASVRLTVRRGSCYQPLVFLGEQNSFHQLNGGIIVATSFSKPPLKRCFTLNQAISDFFSMLASAPAVAFWFLG